MGGEAYVPDIADESPELDPETFDLDAWIGGVTGTVRSVTIYKRADLIGVVDDLRRELRLAERIPDEDRGINDPSPETIRRQLEEVAREFEQSGLVFKVEGRSEEVRERIAKRLKKQGVTDEETVTLHQVADAIIEPKGITPEFLRKLKDKSEAQYQLLLNAAVAASAMPPAVDVPFSRTSSQGRKRRGSE